MKNQKITRTVSIATVDAALYDMANNAVKNVHLAIPTMQKLAEKDVEEYISENFSTFKFLKVLNAEYETSLFEIDLQTFVEHAKVIGSGRKALKE